jgi:cytochrome c biogenesis protein CcdA
MILLLISFIAGVLTVLAPCILPLLPVIVGGTLSNQGTGTFNKKKALTIILSLGISVVIFTLLLKASTLFIDIPEYVWKWISGGIVIFIGLVTLFPSLWESKMLARLSARSNILLGKGEQKKSLTGDIIVGAALGPVFSTCSPTYFIVLATVLPVNFLLGLIYLLTYTIGLCLSLLIVSIDKNFPEEIFNLGSGRKEELMDFIAMIEKACGKEGKKEFMDMQPGDVKASLADISKAKIMLGYEPKTMINDGIPQFVAWYRKYHTL